MLGSNKHIWIRHVASFFKRGGRLILKNVDKQQEKDDNFQNPYQWKGGEVKGGWVTPC